MWVMNQVNKNQSMIELTLSDNKNLNVHDIEYIEMLYVRAIRA